MKKIKHSELVAVTRHFVTPASLHTVLLHPSVTWLGITLCNIPRSSLIFFLPSFGIPFPRTFLLLAAKFSSSSFSPLYHPPSLLPVFHSGGRPVTRSYRNAMTRKWNVLSRAVIHLFYLTSPHTAVGAEIAISGHRRRFSRP